MSFLSIGIDYGSKTAGTTVIAYVDESREVTIQQSQKNQDADQMILDFFGSNGYEGKCYLDAPLSLPGVYQGLPGYENYFYRKSDAIMKAMSPMFLGGLTARAMRLRSILSGAGVEVLETYPKMQAEFFGLHKRSYKKETSAIRLLSDELAEIFSLSLPEIRNWHQFDAILAMITGLKASPAAFGDSQEGLIWV